jgi:hypothetical protein
MELKGNFLIINLDVCFECGKPKDEMHHVVPQLMGGINVIPLCGVCHGKAHGVNRKDGLSDLIKEGLTKAKDKGVKLGRPKLSNEIDELIIKLHNNGLTQRKIATIVGVSHTTVGRQIKKQNN